MSTTQKQPVTKSTLSKKLMSYSAAASAALLVGTASQMTTTPADAAPIILNPGLVIAPGVPGVTTVTTNFGVSGATFLFRVINNTAGVSWGAIQPQSSLQQAVLNQSTYTGGASTRMAQLPTSVSIGGPANLIPGYSIGYLWFPAGGAWFGGGRGFAGISFEQAGQTHYGWFDVEADAANTQMTVHRFGYESAPGTPMHTVVATSGAPIPEPTTATLTTLALGAAGLYAWRRKRKADQASTTESDA